MLCDTFTYTGSAARQQLTTAAEPKWLFVAGDTAQAASQHGPEFWVGRSNVFNAGASYLNGFRIRGTELHIGTSVISNTSAVAYHGWWIGSDSSEDFDIVSILGNAQNGRDVPLPQADKTPVWALAKRDGSREAVLKVGTSTTMFLGGGTPSDCIAFGLGKLTLTNSVNVNEYDSGSGLGEGIEFLVGYDSGDTLEWIGTGIAGRTFDVGADACALLIGHDIAATSGRMITDTMAAGQTKPLGAAAFAANEATLSGGVLTIGSTTTLNQLGKFYAAVIFRRKTTGIPTAPAIILKDKQAISLPGRGTLSGIACGTSDTVLLGAAHSIEFCGAVWPNPGTGGLEECPLIVRSNGAINTPGNSSWGAYLQQPNDFSLNWSGPQLCAHVDANATVFVPPLNDCAWRTGILVPVGQFFHAIFVQDGTGQCWLYLNGKLVKHRMLSGIVVTPVSGHRTYIGARYSSGIVRAQQMMFRNARVYNAAISADDAYRRYERAMLGSSSADVTTNLVEAWDASDATGSSLPAQVNSANNGTIVLGSIITL